MVRDVSQFENGVMVIDDNSSPIVYNDSKLVAQGGTTQTNGMGVVRVVHQAHRFATLTLGRATPSKAYARLEQWFVTYLGLKTE